MGARALPVSKVGMPQLSDASKLEIAKKFAKHHQFIHEGGGAIQVPSISKNWTLPLVERFPGRAHNSRNTHAQLRWIGLLSGTRGVNKGAGGMFSTARDRKKGAGMSSALGLNALLLPPTATEDDELPPRVVDEEHDDAWCCGCCSSRSLLRSIIGRGREESVALTGQCGAALRLEEGPKDTTPTPGRWWFWVSCCC